jgi:hypothetical protein
VGGSNRKGEFLLTERVAHQTIEDTLKLLGLNKPLSDGSARLELLRSYCHNDGARFLRLAGFLTACDHYGAENLVKLKISSYSDYRRKLKEIKNAGTLYLAEGPRSLPALTLVKPADSRQDSEAA